MNGTYPRVAARGKAAPSHVEKRERPQRERSHSGRLVRLEAEPRLEADGARSQSRAVLPEVWRRDVVVHLRWVQVKEIEKVEGIAADLELGILAEDGKLG